MYLKIEFNGFRWQRDLQQTENMHSFKINPKMEIYLRDALRDATAPVGRAQPHLLAGAPVGAALRRSLTGQSLNGPGIGVRATLAVFVCVHVYVCLCMCACVYVHACACMHMGVCVSLC